MDEPAGCLRIHVINQSEQGHSTEPGDVAGSLTVEGKTFPNVKLPLSLNMRTGVYFDVQPGPHRGFLAGTDEEEAVYEKMLKKGSRDPRYYSFEDEQYSMPLQSDDRHSTPDLATEFRTQFESALKESNGIPMRFEDDAWTFGDFKLAEVTNRRVVKGASKPGYAEVEDCDNRIDGECRLTSTKPMNEQVFSDYNNGSGMNVRHMLYHTNATKATFHPMSQDIETILGDNKCTPSGQMWLKAVHVDPSKGLFDEGYILKRLRMCEHTMSQSDFGVWNEGECLSGTFKCEGKSHSNVTIPVKVDFRAALAKAHKGQTKDNSTQPSKAGDGNEGSKV